jgi:hypothetical protein
MAAVRQYRFRALVTLDAAAPEGGARGLASRMRALTAHDCCLLQPFCYRVYLPAVISPNREPPLQPGGRVVVTIALAGGEAEALLAPGQRFTIWADAVVGRTIRPEGLVGYGVICAPEAPPLLCDDSDGIRRKATGLARVHRLETGEAVTGDRDQALVVRKSRDATSSC